MVRSATRLIAFLGIVAIVLLTAVSPAFLQEGSPEGAADTAVAEANGSAPGAEESPEPEDTDEADADVVAGEDQDGQALTDDEEEGAAEEPADEEPEEIVWAIVIRGNEHIDAESILRAVTETRVGEPLRLEAIQADLRNIFELGFFEDVRVDAFEVEDGLRLVFQVVENPFVTDVRVESDVVDGEQLRRWVTTRPGQVLNRIQLNDDLERVQDRALEELDLYLQPSPPELDADGVLHLDFKAVRVKDVIIRGNAKTKDFVIRREIVVEPGEPLRRSDLTRSMDRLQRTAYFQDVRVQGIPTDDPNYVSVEFDVEERLTGTAMVGAGYSSEDGLLGYVEVVDRNFLGRGQSASVRAEFGQRRTIYDIGFFEPYLFGSVNSFGINVYDRSFDRLYNDKRYDYRERRQGGSITLGRPLNEFTRMSLRYRAENLRTEALESDSLHDPSKGSVRTITLASTTDTTDHWLSPVRGSRTRLSAELGGGWLGGTYSFTKYEGEHSRYFKVGSKRQAIAVRAIGGWGVGRDIEAAEEQFRVGGADTIRGYRSGEFEGDRMLVFNAEYRFPMSDSVQGVIFADAGEAWWSRDGSKGLKFGYGIGARMDTPLGVLRLDYGIGDSGRLHFFFGPSF